MLGSTLGTWVETSSCVSIVALIGKGYKLVPLASWVDLLNNLTSSMYCRTLRPADGHSVVLGTEVGCLWVGPTQVGGYSMEITDTPIGSGLSYF